MFFILPLGVTGLTLLDLDPHLYEGLDEVSLPTVSFTENPIGSGIYRIDDLPDAFPSIRRTFTAKYPEGVGHSFLWGGEENGTPSTLVIPIKEGGLTQEDFTFLLYRDGVSQDSITVEVGDPLQPSGDYPISGWPIESTGSEWLVVWSREGSGIFNLYTWKELALPASPGSGMVISCSAIHPPFDIGVDDTGRASFSCNYALRLNGFFQFDKAFANYLESELYGFVDVDIFYGRVVQYPSEGHVILLIPQSGYGTIKANDNSNITRPVLQVLVFDPQRDMAQEVANDIFMKLDVMVNTDLSGMV